MNYLESLSERLTFGKCYIIFVDLVIWYEFKIWELIVKYIKATLFWRDATYTKITFFSLCHINFVTEMPRLCSKTYGVILLQQDHSVSDKLVFGCLSVIPPKTFGEDLKFWI